MAMFAPQRAGAEGFRDQQRRQDRVRNAYEELEPAVKNIFRQRGLDYPPRGIFLRIFKQPGKLELWVQTVDGDFSLLKEYQVCAFSGEAGPKRAEGDLQTPEGFYHITHFNPTSSYHLALHINYPNQSDSILGRQGRLGGDIVIHGGCRSDGCIAMTDRQIKEIYLIAVEARSQGQTHIPVHIFPTQMDDQGMGTLRKMFPQNAQHAYFWENLREGYDSFELHHSLANVTVDRRGRYLFSDP